MIADMKPAPGMNMAMMRGMARWTTISRTKSVMPPMTICCRFDSCSLILSQAAAGPSRTSVTTMSKPVSSARTAVSLVARTSFWRMLAQERPSTENANLAISVSEKALGI